MYKETVQSNKKTLFLILAVVVLGLVLFGILDAFHLPYRAVWELILFAALGVLTYFLIRFNLTDYKYVFIENELIFQKKAGHEDLVLLTIEIHQVESLQPFESYHEEVKIPREFTHMIKKNFTNARAWVCTFRQDGNLCKVVFEPTPTLVKMIEKRLAIIASEDAAPTEEASGVRENAASDTK